MRYQNLELHNVAELLEGDGSVVLPPHCRKSQTGIVFAPEAILRENAEGLWLSRLPNALRVTLNPNAVLHAVGAGGVELRFNLRSETARVRLRCLGEARLAEVWQGSFFVNSQVVGTHPTDIVIPRSPHLDKLVRLTEQYRLPFDARLTRVLLPWWPPVRLLGITGEMEPPTPAQTPARRYLAYGSSITHGATAARPSGTYVHRVAELLGVDLINLGFGGGAHLEPQLAAYITGRTDWNFATVETGINVRSRSADEFRGLVENFIPPLARACPDRWLFCTGVYTCGADLIPEDWVHSFRAIVQQTVQQLQQPRVLYLDGRALLPNVTGLREDLVHPSPAGQEELARNLAAAMRPYLG